MALDEDVIKFTDNGMGVKWASLYDEHANISSTRRKFDARIDDTDHTSFYCEKCNREVRIIDLTFYKESKDEQKLKLVHTLFFHLFCETCGGTETKKMYINNPLLGTDNWK